MNYAQLTQFNKDFNDSTCIPYLNGLIMKLNTNQIIFFAEIRILAFPCNQFAGVMPEGDGDEMLCHLKEKNADLGGIFAKVLF